jgi:hypothetical protein
MKLYVNVALEAKLMSILQVASIIDPCDQMT